MKKIKILAMILPLVSMGLVGCGHEHEFSEWKVKTAATCSVQGVEERICECGEVETRAIPTIAHTEVWKNNKETGKHWKECSKCHTKLTEEEACTKVADHDKDVAPTYTADGSNAFKCSVCNLALASEKVDKLVRNVTVVKEWTQEETIAGYSGKVQSNGEIKFGKTDSITLTFTSSEAQTVQLEINSGYKYVNISYQFFCDSNFTKDRYLIYLNGTSDSNLVAQNYNNMGEAGKSSSAADVGLTVESATLKDGDESLTEFAWVTFADLDLVAGENTITIKANHGGYTPWIHNVRLVK